jgi:hypothetical protein
MSFVDEFGHHLLIQGGKMLVSFDTTPARSKKLPPSRERVE